MIRCVMVPMPDTFKIDDPDSRICRGCEKKVADHVLEALDYTLMYPCCDTEECRDTTRSVMEAFLAANTENLSRRPAKKELPWHLPWIRSLTNFKPDLV